MLQQLENGIYEQNNIAVTMTYTAQFPDSVTGGIQNTTNYPLINIGYYQPYTWWHTYPVYVCSDKTKKAIEVLQAMEADGFKVTSVPKFIKLVEKIAAIL
jgi:hypothetical protein